MNLFQRHGSQIIMWLLIAVTIAAPVSDAHPHIGAILALVVLISILAGASLSGNRRIVVLVAIPLSGLWMLARLLEEFGNGQHIYNHLPHAFGLVLSCVLIWAIFGRLSAASRVTSTVLAEAFISYLIIAIAYSQVYWILNEVVPNPFNQRIPPTEGATLLYFSMVSLSGVGYGDITPVNPFVRIIAALESMTGIFYLAIVVSRLVSSYRPAPSADRES